MEHKLINPRRLEVGYFKVKSRVYAMKSYKAIVGRPTRGLFRTATARSVRIFRRWCRLYDAAVLNMTSSSPAVTEEEQVVEAEG